MSDEARERLRANEQRNEKSKYWSVNYKNWLGLSLINNFLDGGAWGGVRVGRGARDDTRSVVKSLLQSKSIAK